MTGAARVRGYVQKLPSGTPFTTASVCKQAQVAPNCAAKLLAQLCREGVVQRGEDWRNGLPGSYVRVAGECGAVLLGAALTQP